MTGKIIFINGASSAGKSTLCQALQAQLAEPFWHVSIDHFISAHMLPQRRAEGGAFAWQAMRPHFFEGFHRCLPALATAGNNLLVEHIVETATWMERLLHLLAPYDLFFVGLHCPLPELERRERSRGDRPLGDARNDFYIAHTFGEYDLEIDSTAPLTENVATVIAAWQARRQPGAFQRMAGLTAATKAAPTDASSQPGNRL